MQRQLTKLPPNTAENLLRGAPAEVLEGIFKGNRVVVSEWENADKARAYYNSPEYTRAKAKRMEDVAEAAILLFEGA